MIKLYQIWPWLGTSLVACERPTILSSGFVDDAVFLHSGPRTLFYGASCAPVLDLTGENVTAEAIASITANFCSTIKISKYHRELRTGAKSARYDCLIKFMRRL